MQKVGIDTEYAPRLSSSEDGWLYSRWDSVIMNICRCFGEDVTLLKVSLG